MRKNDYDNFSSIFSEFSFYGYGCCNFDSIIRTIYEESRPGNETNVRKWSLHYCKKRCLNDPQCIAIDIAKDLVSGPDDGEFKCYLSKGSGRNFKIGCPLDHPINELNDPDKDLLKRKCYKLNRPGKRNRTHKLKNFFSICK